MPETLPDYCQFFISQSKIKVHACEPYKIAWFNFPNNNLINYVYVLYDENLDLYSNSAMYKYMYYM